MIGGHSPAACRRAITTANGWYGVYLDLTQTAETLATLHTIATRHERPPELGELEITITPPGPIDPATAQRYADLGVHRLVLHSTDTDGSGIEKLIQSTAHTLIGRQ